MATSENAPDAVLAVADPNTSADDLRLIAAVRPDLHTAIAAHPNAYAGLLDWMESLGNPEVVAAVAQRRAFDAGAVPASAPTAQSADASTPTFVDAIEQPDTQVHEPAQDVTLESTQVEEEPETTVDQVTMPSQGQMPVGYMPAGTIPQQGYQQPMNYQGQYPVQGVSMQPAKNSTNKSLVIILAVLAVIAIVLVVGVVGAFAGWFDSGSSSDTSADSMTQSAQTHTQAQTPAQPQSAKPEVKEKYPAPSSAMVADTFSAPSGNIICTLDGDMVSCQINETHWTGAAGYEVCGDNRGALFTVDSKNTNYSCANIAPPMNGKYISSLAYGSYVKNGNVACISTQDGISCWNTISGNSFAVAREGWMFDTKGEILPSQFIWNQ
ncbi:MAG: variant leucine-rich repeat-containing protein [Schaalia turicensis]